MKKASKIITYILVCVFIFLSVLVFNSASWYLKKYGDVGFDSIIYALYTNNAGLDLGIVKDYLINVLPITLIFVSIIYFILFLRSNLIIKFPIKKFKITIYALKQRVSVILSVILSVLLLFGSTSKVGFFTYFWAKINPSTLYEENYVDPSNVNIQFPETKQNLVYIFMEAMETTYFSAENGGALKTNVMPELYDLSINNLNFSNTGGVGGGYVLPGAAWTIAGMVAQTAGINLNLPFDGNSLGDDGIFMPNLHTLTDILHKNGYYQSFMCGSDSNYGGRRQFFTEHGVDKIYDYYTAMDDGIIEKDFHDDWWGFSDYDLYKYAKQELPKISSEKEPFAFFMLTVDTHFENGNVCKYCGNDYEEQYENVFSCASKQLGEFMEWAKTQDFYENTTFVIVGDHNSMNMGYVERNVPDNYERMLYNTFVNPVKSTEISKNRFFSQVDIFPTTLAALGCEIEGDVLGLGVNLFSGNQTLVEKMGIDNLCYEIMRRSKLYDTKFLDIYY